MAKIWVTGAAGLIGNRIVQQADLFAPKHEVIGLARKDLDLTDASAIRDRFAADRPDVIVHCAAMSRPVDCEREPETARKVNIEATALLAELAADKFMMYFSTDLVLDGVKGDYTEEDQPIPLHEYGRSKLKGEEQVAAYSNHAILRTALNFGESITGDRAFNEQMHLALQSGKDFTLFEDEFRCPLSADVTARAVWEMVDHRVGGVFMLGGAEKVSRWQIGKGFYDRWGELPGKITPGSLKDYHGPPRSADLSMNCRKIQSLLSFPLPGFHEWLAANANARI